MRYLHWNFNLTRLHLTFATQNPSPGFFFSFGVLGSLQKSLLNFFFNCFVVFKFSSIFYLLCPFSALILFYKSIKTSLSKMQHVRRTGFSLKTRWLLYSNVVKSCNKLDSFLEYVPSRSLSDVGIGRFSSMAAESAVFNVSAKRVCEVLLKNSHCCDWFFVFLLLLEWVCMNYWGFEYILVLVRCCILNFLYVVIDDFDQMLRVTSSQLLHL